MLTMATSMLTLVTFGAIPMLSVSTSELERDSYAFVHGSIAGSARPALANRRPAQRHRARDGGAAGGLRRRSVARPSYGPGCAGLAEAGEICGLDRHLQCDLGLAVQLPSGPRAHA